MMVQAGTCIAIFLRRFLRRRVGNRSRLSEALIETKGCPTVQRRVVSGSAMSLRMAASTSSSSRLGRLRSLPVVHRL